jgi:hypothetical protein
MSSMHNDFSDTLPAKEWQDTSFRQAAEAATEIGQDDSMPMRRCELLFIAAVATVGILAWTLLARWL